MPISFAVNKGLERGVAYVALPSGTDEDGDAVVTKVFRANLSELGEVLMFAGVLKSLAQAMVGTGQGPIAVYNPEDFEERGPDLPYGFQFEQDE